MTSFGFGRSVWGFWSWFEGFWWFSDIGQSQESWSCFFDLEGCVVYGGKVRFGLAGSLQAEGANGLKV